VGKTRDIREPVEKELSYDPLVDATSITVKNLKGDVALNGTWHGSPGGRGRPHDLPDGISSCEQSAARGRYARVTG
jgi:hypothetical protein